MKGTRKTEIVKDPETNKYRKVRIVEETDLKPYDVFNEFVGFLRRKNQLLDELTDVDGELTDIQPSVADLLDYALLSKDYGVSLTDAEIDLLNSVRLKLKLAAKKEA